MSNLLKIINKLPSGDYIRIRNSKHLYLGEFNNTDKQMHILGVAMSLSYKMIIIQPNALIQEGDVLYRIEDINSVQVKPLIYL